jgi:hypothetical protein
MYSCVPQPYARRVPSPVQMTVRLTWTPDHEPWPGGYSNVFLLNFSPWEFNIRFGHLVIPPSPPDEASVTDEGPVEVPVKPVGQIVVSPPQMKALRQHLDDQITQYEAAYGPITEFNLSGD